MYYDTHFNRSWNGSYLFGENLQGAVEYFETDETDVTY